MRSRLALRYAIEGDLRFISHQDSLRLFERALARAGIPVRYSQGFNPRPRIRIALPRPVGVTSFDELLLVELASQMEPTDLQAALSLQVPPGMTIVSAEVLADGDRRLPCEACYAVDIEPAEAERVAKDVAEFLLRDCVEIRRIVYKTRLEKTVNIRRYVLAAGVDDDCLRWRQSITPTGTARVGEVLDTLALPSRDYLHRLRREQVSCER